MPRNSQLSKAKKAKNDDFYTSRKDIEDELCHYEDQFRDKVVYCNCDDPEYSEFWKFFMRNFVPWGLKKLIATHYDPNEKNYAYMLEMTPEIANGGGGIAADPIRKPIQSNGDFRSAACIELLEEADIVVSNPPFSKFREYVNQLIQYNKKFLIMGNMSAITYKEIFPLIKDNKMWPGYGFNKTMEFIMPDDYELKGKAYIDDDGKKHGFVPAICWYTNLDVKKRHEPLDSRGTYYSPERYPKYDNYDAIEVGRVSDIPCDYFEEIGVPITFLSKYNPDQFELIGADFDLANPEPLPNGKTGNGRFYVRERERERVRRMYSRLVIRRKKS